MKTIDVLLSIGFLIITIASSFAFGLFGGLATSACYAIGVTTAVVRGK